MIYANGTATLALAGEPKVLQTRLGHANIVTTGDTYVSVLSQVASEAAERATSLILRDADRVHRPGRLHRRL